MTQGNPEYGMPIAVGEQGGAAYWPEECGHGGYLGSSIWYASDGTDRKIDVYLFETDGRQQVCIRYGSEAHQYISPGTPCNVLLTAFQHGRDLQEYVEALDILMSQGDFVWIKK